MTIVLIVHVINTEEVINRVCKLACQMRSMFDSEQL